MQRFISGQHLGRFQQEVNDALADGWRVVPGTTFAECGFYELSAPYKRDYDKTTALEWFYSIVVERPNAGNNQDQES